LEKVVGLKERAIPTLAALLQDGPSVPQLARYDLHLRNGLPRRPLEASVTLDKARLDYRFRFRAATALAAIGGTSPVMQRRGEAEAALARALTLQLDPDIRNHVETLLRDLRTRKK